MFKFVGKVPEFSKEEFKAFVMEGDLVVKTSLQSALDIVDASPRLMSLVVRMNLMFL